MLEIGHLCEGWVVLHQNITQAGSRSVGLQGLQGDVFTVDSKCLGAVTEWIPICKNRGLTCYDEK